MNDSIYAKVKLTNTGKYDGKEVVQLYYYDLVASITRPLKLLCGFEKVILKSGESKEISFAINSPMFKFYRLDMTLGVEPGYFDLLIGGNSSDLLTKRFYLNMK